jgi:hypothetical protein
MANKTSYIKDLNAKHQAAVESDALVARIRAALPPGIELGYTPQRPGTGVTLGPALKKGDVYLDVNLANLARELGVPLP